MHFGTELSSEHLFHMQHNLKILMQIEALSSGEGNQMIIDFWLKYQLEV